MVGTYVSPPVGPPRVDPPFDDNEFLAPETPDPAGEQSKSEEVVDAEAITTDSLEALQSNDQRKIMDVVDKLRRTGLNGMVQLPQLVVCGDQSSGKSSVLEAITAIPFPRRENLCTRFATEIVMRRDKKPSISTKIIPDKNRPDAERRKLMNFRKSIHDFSQLPALMDEATALMGLGKVGSDSNAFSRDVLSIEICGPDRPQLTLVDLPGLIHSENKSQSKQDVELIRNLVEDYISNERTIILAVISAKNDYANQIILEHCRRVDSKGSRTLGIITKPDFLRAGSENERDWISLAKNQDIYFELGWHMLKNRADGELNTSFQERNYSERSFFSKGSYQQLSRDMVGIDSLRTRLSRLLHNHLKRELPDLKKEVDTLLQETMEHLDRLGKKRTSLSEQRLFLADISTSIYDLLKSAVNGQYTDPFFGDVDLDAEIDSQENMCRLRAVIQHLNIEFAEKMRMKGSKYTIDSAVSESDGEESDGEESDGEDEDDSTQETLTHSEAVDWVLGVLQRTRGCELPGNFNPSLIGQLFREQSQPWESLAIEHIERVSEVCDRFVRAVLEHVTTPDIQSRLLDLRIEGALENSLKTSKQELGKVIADKARHPMTYNHYYTTTIQKSRQEKYSGHLTRIAEGAKSTVTFTKADQIKELISFIDSDKLQGEIECSIEQDMDKFSAEEALGNERAYYKDELKYFIAVVTKQVIERHLVDTLPSTILSPMVVAGLTDEEISFVAAEPADVTQQRAYYEAKKEMLEKGVSAFRKAMGGP